MSEHYSIKEYSVKNAKKVLFFFPAGFTKMWHYRFTVLQLNRMGISVIGFDFSWKNAIRTWGFDEFKGVIEEVDQTVDEIISRQPDIDYSVLGLSFGSVLSLYTAKRHKSIKSIILFVPYGTVSHLLWTHKPSRPFIENLIKNGLKSEQDLEKLTLPIETRYQLDKLKDRKIVSFLGRSDKIVFDGEKLVHAIKKNEINASFYESRFGHLGTSLIGLAQKSKWSKIL